MNRLLCTVFALVVGLGLVMTTETSFARNPHASTHASSGFHHPPHHALSKRERKRLLKRLRQRMKRHASCHPRRTRGVVSRRCFERLIDDPEVASVLESPELVPALADGRLDIDALVRRLEISEAVPTTRRGAEADPEEVVTLDRGILAELEKAPGFDSPDAVIAGRRGPTLSESYAPQTADDFGFTPIPDKTYLDIAGFTLGLHALLAPNVNGYAMRMRSNGTTVATLQWNWARNPNPADAPAAGWNTNRRMHIVSLSKFMTTIGLVHMLKANNIDTSAKIINYLPTYWNPGPNIGLITFEHLMNHLSGFSTGGSSSNWQTLKSQVEAGVPAANVGTVSDYENMNFGLMRVLMSIIGGYVNPNTDLGFDLFNDLFWDVLTSASYEQYMKANIFNPHGVFPVHTKSPSTALAHRYDASGTGWNSGSFTGSPGGVGWHFTINEVLDVARALRSGQIVGFSDAQEILDKSWGLNSPTNGYATANGPVYYKPGRWTDNGDPSVARTEQCLLMMMPDGLEVAVFVNSEVTASGMSLTSLVRTLYENNLVTLP